ncbi:50S ribosomal protein L11 methyltransferase [Rhodoferax sp. 4810]|uniref:Ribosomal protein L11 methyltransferase n=1 Tax=Thiospirillum jenense TaxID=1653858 RepID=A0A839H8A6_9GAMM|nr:50S ribosomal protein L11 methyltransferase [Thiospirillum jenense]MBB1074200.1 50S ribosomal protein L11 methyltransferase [Rhodoferax jenense]MBB1125274.1 50S ribosomal protein L11 methyltransferase [Thiospirillum jenense]
MSWLALTLTTTPTAAPQLEAALERAGASAVTLQDGGDDPILEPALDTTPLWAVVRIQALFENTPVGQAQAQHSAQLLAGYLTEVPTIQPLADQPWERAWLKHRQPQCFADRLWVGAQEQLAALTLPTDAAVVKLDPGLAFGTGDHPTTALCLQWLAQAQLLNETVIDYGCGSGILAIAAIQLGAARAIAIDHDPQALEATAANAAVNNVTERLLITSPMASAIEPAAVVIANILAKPLIELAPHLCALVNENGHLVLSGILAHQVDAVMAAYQPIMHFAPVQLQDEWALLHARRAINRAA